MYVFMCICWCNVCIVYMNSGRLKLDLNKEYRLKLELTCLGWLVFQTNRKGIRPAVGASLCADTAASLGGEDAHI